MRPSLTLPQATPSRRSRLLQATPVGLVRRFIIQNLWRTMGAALSLHRWYWHHQCRQLSGVKNYLVKVGPLTPRVRANHARGSTARRAAKLAPRVSFVTHADQVK